tara:strand:+ start:1597 stop:1812 length:216 start_codon:yes stop_codon:yes gene_type:complete
MENRTLLNPKTYSPGFITKDETWCAVPYGNRFMILNNGKQIQVFNTLDNAKSFIKKQLKQKNSSATLNSFL